MTENNNEKKRQHRALTAAVQAGIAVFFFLYFTKIAPLVVFDSDDWIFLGSRRIPLPIWRGWNPTRVLPETLLPISGWAAAHLFYPLCGDFVSAVTFAGAVIVTFFAAFLCWCAFLFAKKRLSLSVWGSLLFEAFFLCLQFLIFRNRGGSRNLFTAADYSCVFFYTVSGMVNGSSILLLMSSSHFEEDFRRYAGWKKVLFFLLLYGALFSNLFHSGILAVYCGLHLLEDWLCLTRSRGKESESNTRGNSAGHESVSRRKVKISSREVTSGNSDNPSESRERNHGNWFRKFCRDNWLHFLILLLWLIVLLFEANGGRADSVEGGRTFDFAGSLRQLKALISALSIPYVTLTMAALAAGIFLFLRERRTDAQTFISCAISILLNGLVLTLYLLVLNSVIGYMSRIDATWGIWFWCVLLTDVIILQIFSGIGSTGGKSVGKAVNRKEAAEQSRALGGSAGPAESIDRKDALNQKVPDNKLNRNAVPAWGAAAALLGFCILFSILPDGKYMSSTRDPKGYEHSLQISEYLCGQVMQAAGAESVSELRIPDYRGTELEWAISGGIGTNISDTLYSYGIIDNIPELHVIYDSSLN